MKLTIADAQAADNLDLGVSEWFAIDQERINAFADATEDHQWIHIDAEKAKESEFGGTIAHGFLVLSLVPRLFTELFELTGAKSLINYGIDKVRFIQPVPSGSEIRLEAKLVKGSLRGGNLLMRVRGELVLRATGRRAAVAEILFLAVPE